MKRYRFEAAIQRSAGWGAFVFFPHDTLNEFGIKGRVPVQARLAGIPYTGSLMPRREAFHLLAVPSAIMEQLNKKPGDLLEIELCRDDEPRTVVLPDEFTKLLRRRSSSPGLKSSPSPAAKSTETGSFRRNGKKHGKGGWPRRWKRSAPR